MAPTVPSYFCIARVIAFGRSRARPKDIEQSVRLCVTTGSKDRVIEEEPTKTGNNGGMK
jgi:hypothetical protein